MAGGPDLDPGHRCAERWPMTTTRSDLGDHACVRPSGHVGACRCACGVGRRAPAATADLAAVERFLRDEASNDSPVAGGLLLAEWPAVRAEAARLAAENERLRSALGRVTDNLRLAVAGRPVRDVTETLAEVEAALAPDAAAP